VNFGHSEYQNGAFVERDVAAYAAVTIKYQREYVTIPSQIISDEEVNIKTTYCTFTASAKATC
jgi:hypothetical protein